MTALFWGGEGGGRINRRVLSLPDQTEVVSGSQICPVPRSEKHGSGTDSDYDNTQVYDVSLSMGRSSEEEGRGESEDGGGGDAPEPDPALPCTEDVILKTEQVTKNIQELLRAAQEGKHDSFVPCSEKIHTAVTEMASLFPKRPALEAVHCSLRLLASSASRLQGRVGVGELCITTSALHYTRPFSGWVLARTH
ncbi:hypothetical protein CRUP_029894 [Coryphaenoides rupestris]|nr:hypothetical protein CRUP_029894 [Coryphaenoides rupestris]